MSIATTKRKPRAEPKRSTVRYAVVGLGHIAQVAILPAFGHATKNSSLTALVSDDRTKLAELSKKYSAEDIYYYEDYDSCLKSGNVDAVFIALPNSMHREYAVRAAKAGVHVLCEKPMAVTEADCEAMIRAAEENNVKLMIAYRLHFEEANLKALQIVRSGQLGEPRFFASNFGLQVEEGNIRLQKALGGGTLYDIGIYCINAARNLFRAEPIEVVALTANNGESRFSELEEMTGALLRFPDERLASFTCSFGSADVDTYQIVGTKGDLRLSPAYTYHGELEYELTIEGKTKRQSFSPRDQFAPELLYFSDCILNNKTPEPSGIEGQADVRIIEALYRSARDGRAVKLPPVAHDQWPTREQEIRRPAVSKPETVKVRSPRGDE